MKSKNYILFLAIILCQLIQTGLFSQDPEEKAEQLIVKNADNFIVERIDGKDVQYFRGNVRLVQDSTFMFCDSAKIIENQLTATDEVIIIQNDSIQIFSDSLYYDGDLKFAELFYGVVLQNLDKQLFTESLLYDLNTKQASFRDTAILKRGTMTLSSIEGKYNMDTKLAFFYNELVIIDDDFELNADSILYDIEIDRVYFLGPTYIKQDGKKIYCETGYYDLENKETYLEQNAVVRENKTVTKAKTIYYSSNDSLIRLAGDAFVEDSLSVTTGDLIIVDDKTGNVSILGNGYYKNEKRTLVGPEINYNKKIEDLKLYGRSQIGDDKGYMLADSIEYTKSDDFGWAIGEVIWIDTLEDRTLQSDKMYFRDSSSYYKAVSVDKRPLFKQIVDEDTLYVSADILKSGELEDSTQYLQGIRDVKIYKSDFQAVCDSLYYSSRDSNFILYFNPICWSDTTQFSGDTIIISLKDGSISEIQAQSNGFILNKISVNYYNQVSARNIHSYLDSNALKRMDAIGNAMSIYMVKDEDDAYIGSDKTECNDMSFYFANDSLDRISFRDKADSEFVPMDIVKQEDLYLQGLNWQVDLQPNDPDEIRKLSATSITVKDIKTENEEEFESSVLDILNSEMKGDSLRLESINKTESKKKKKN